MARLICLPLLVFPLCATLSWTAAQYLEMQSAWRRQRAQQPRCRPMLSRPVVMQR